MKKNLPTILLVILCVAVLFCTHRVTKLDSEVESLRNSLNNSVGDLSRSMSVISYDIEQKLEEQANLISEQSSSYLDADIANKTVVSRFEVVPKVYAPDSTAVSVICNDSEYPMIYTGGRYVADITIPLFESSTITSVRLNDNGTVRTQSVRYHLSPAYDFLPMVFARYDGSWRSSRSDKKYIKKYDGDVRISVESKNGNDDIASMSLVEYLDGKIIEVTDVPRNHVPTPSENTYKVAEYPATPLDDNYTVSSPYYFYLKKDVEIPFGSTYELYSDVVDNNGLHHITLLDVEEIAKNGTRIDNIVHSIGSESSIYDADGNLLRGANVVMNGGDMEIPQKIAIASGK